MSLSKSLSAKALLLAGALGSGTGLATDHPLISAHDHYLEAVRHTETAAEQASKGESDRAGSHIHMALTHLEAGRSLRSKAHVRAAINSLVEAETRLRGGSLEAGRKSLDEALIHLVGEK